MSDMERFWMVYVEGTQTATVRHPDIETAKTEAERLARKTHSRVFLLEAVSAFVLPETGHWINI